jgi:hypothetical protein
MHRTIKLALAIAIAALLVSDIAFAESRRSAQTPVFNTPIITRDFLREMDWKQRGFLRRAIELCRIVGWPTRAELDFCVIVTSDKAIENTQSMNLIAFHNALPATARYDLQRSWSAWYPWVMEY